MATATKTAKGFKAPCIKCGEPCTVSLDLADVDTFSCSSCDETFTTAEVRELVAEWSKVLDWIALAPAAD